MNKKIIKNLVAFAMLAFLAAPVVAMAQLTDDLVGIDVVDNTVLLGNTDPRETVAQLINTAMLFLGIIAVGIVLIGGFKWMTAGGNEDKVGEAKKLMGAGIVGLIIVLSAWGIATFILTRLIDATA
jgi:TRAP-type C4-dicarboxylate transport system permease small subunit